MKFVIVLVVIFACFAPYVLGGTSSISIASGGGAEQQFFGVSYYAPTSAKLISITKSTNFTFDSTMTQVQFTTRSGCTRFSQCGTSKHDTWVGGTLNFNFQPTSTYVVAGGSLNVGWDNCNRGLLIKDQTCFKGAPCFLVVGGLTITVLFM